MTDNEQIVPDAKPADEKGRRQGNRRRSRSKGGKSLKYLARSIVLEEIGPPNALRVSLMLLVAGVLCFVAWAAITPLTETARATGNVVPDGSIVSIQHLEGGIVSEILVKDGELVKPDTVLIRLDPTAAIAELEENRARIAALSVQAERLRAFADDRAPNFTNIDPEFAPLAADQLAIHKLQSESRLQEKIVLQSQIEQRQSELEVLREQASSLREQIKIAAELTEMRGRLMRSGHVSRVLFLRTKQELKVSEGELRGIIGKTGQARQAIAEARGKLAEAEAKRKDAAATEMGRITGELAQLLRTVERSRNRVHRTEIRSPIHGYVKGLQIRTIGAVIAPGGVVTEVVPNDQELFIEARVLPSDIGHVEIGQKATVTVTTYDFSRYGSMEGSVDRISASTFVEEDGNVYYKAIIKLGSKFVGGEPGKNPIAPGMIAEVAINTGEKTLLKYLLRPVYVALDRSFGER